MSYLNVALLLALAARLSYSAIFMDARNRTTQPYVVPEQSFSSRSPTLHEYTSALLSVVAAGEHAVVDHYEDALNATSIQQAVRRNIIRGAGGKAAVSLPKLSYIKKELCKSEELRQIIREPGCQATPIQNRFCYGQCNSFYIPTSARPRRAPDPLAPRAPSAGGTAFRSCSFCRPKRAEWMSVRLHCPRRGPQAYRVKRIQIVKECACTALNLD